MISQNHARPLSRRHSHLLSKQQTPVFLTSLGRQSHRNGHQRPDATTVLYIQENSQLRLRPAQEQPNEYGNRLSMSKFEPPRHYTPFLHAFVHLHTPEQPRFVRCLRTGAGGRPTSCGARRGYRPSIPLQGASIYHTSPAPSTPRIKSPIFSRRALRGQDI